MKTTSKVEDIKNLKNRQECPRRDERLTGKYSYMFLLNGMNVTPGNKANFIVQ